MALRLLPLADEYQMAALKDRCERLLVSILKKTPVSKLPKGPPAMKNRRDNTPEFLLKCTKAADQGNSKILSEQCIKMFASPEVPLKDLKMSNEISDSTKSKIYAIRMDNASTKLSKMANELDKEKHEKEMLKKQLTDRFTQKRGMAMSSYASEPNIDDVHSMTGSKQPSKLPHSYLSHQR